MTPLEQLAPYMGFEIRTAACRIAAQLSAMETEECTDLPLGQAGALCLQLGSEYVGDHLFIRVCGRVLYLDDPHWTPETENYAWVSILENFVGFKKNLPDPIIIGRYHAFCYLLHEALAPTQRHAGRVADGILHIVVREYPDVYRIRNPKEDTDAHGRYTRQKALVNKLFR